MLSFQKIIKPYLHDKSLFKVWKRLIPNKSVSIKKTISLDAQKGAESGANNKSLCSIVAPPISGTCRASLLFCNTVNMFTEST